MKITHCKLSKKVQLKLLEFFVVEVTARTASDLLGIQHNSSALFYYKILTCDRKKPKIFLMVRFKLDESNEGGICKGKQGRGAGGKTAVFGLLKRHGKVFVVVVKDTKTDTLMPIIASKIKPDSIVYTDSYKSYNALDVSDFKHFRINHSKEFAKDHNHVGGIENFWSQAKHKYHRHYNGINKKHFHLFIKD